MGAITAQDAGLIKALVDEFNGLNYGIEDISTNLWYREETNELVTNISCSPGTKPGQYLLKMREETTKKFYSSENGTKEHFNINSFPFDLTKGKLRSVGENIYEFATPVDNKVLYNFKKYFTEGIILNLQMLLCQQTRENLNRMTKMMISEPLDDLSPYLDCTSFVTEGTQDGHSYNLLVKSVKLLSQISEFLGLEIRDHWNISSDDCQMMLKKENFNEEFVRKMSSLTKMRIAEDFNYSRSQDEKIGNYKDIVTETIFILTGMKIDGYIRDHFIHEEEEKIRNEERIVVIPTIKNGDGKTRYLTSEEAKNINKAFEYLGFGDAISNIEGKTESTKGKKNGGTYGISNKQLANLIQTFIRNSFVTTSGRFEIDPSLTHEQKLGCMPLKRPRVSSVNSAQQDFNKKSHLSPFKENNDRTSMGSSRSTVSSDSQIAGEEEILTTSCEEDIAQQNNVHEQLYTTSEETYMENIPPNTVIKNNTNQKSLEKKTNGEIHTTSPLNQDDNKENSVSAMTSGKKKFSKKNTDKVGNTSKEQKPQASFVKEPQVSNLVQEKQKKKGFLSRIASYFR